MLNRRFLRVKVLQEIYAYRQSNSNDIPKAEDSNREILEEVEQGSVIEVPPIPQESDYQNVDKVDVEKVMREGF